MHHMLNIYNQTFFNVNISTASLHMEFKYQHILSGHKHVNIIKFNTKYGTDRLANINGGTDSSLPCLQQPATGPVPAEYSSHLTSYFIMIHLSSHISLDLPMVSSFRIFWLKILYEFLTAHIYATLTFIDWATINIV
jgi:hypothetical protein